MMSEGASGHTLPTTTTTHVHPDSTCVRERKEIVRDYNAISFLPQDRRAPCFMFALLNEKVHSNDSALHELDLLADDCLPPAVERSSWQSKI